MKQILEGGGGAEGFCQKYDNKAVHNVNRFKVTGFEAIPNPKSALIIIFFFFFLQNHVVGESLKILRY